MTRDKTSRCRQCAFTLVEVIISILIIMVLATGAMGYQYYSTRDVKVSEVQVTAARLSMLLLEAWKGMEGKSDFDPVASFDTDLAIETSPVGPALPDSPSGGSLQLLGRYRVRMEDITYYITLSWEDASTEQPRLLNGAVSWRTDYGAGLLTGDESEVRHSTFFVNY